LPTAAAVLLAFIDYELDGPGLAWIGLDNFQKLFEDRGFRISLRNTLVFVGIVAPASVASALALMIEAAARGQALFRSVFFLPVALGLILAYDAVGDLRATGCSS
jgi:multiple sugar transport system permease protein